MESIKSGFISCGTISLCVLLTTISLSGSIDVSQNQPVVCLSDGCVRGTFRQDSVGSTYSAFLGIPYAKPPIGELRFANPQRNEPWQGTYDATTPKNVCMQQLVVAPNSPLFGTEDCLYLNVYVPKKVYGSSGPLPVMVYIHGGGFTFGSILPDQHDPARFMTSRRVIMVMMQYRLGALGFLATGDSSAPGNFGMKDQVLALRWVRRNIHTFGGDPRRVTIFGESSSGACTQLHMLSPLSRGLFHRTITMSGSALASWSVPIKDPLALTIAHAKVLGIQNADQLSTADLIAQLRRVDARNLTSSTQRLKLWDIHPITLYHPVLEPMDELEPFMVEDPQVAWSRGAYTSVPWMTGTLPQDGTIVSQAIYRDSAVIADANNKFKQLLPLLTGANVTDEKLNALRLRFYSTTPPGMWVTSDNYKDVTRMVSEVYFHYPMVRSIKQHLANRKHTPTSVYSFQFRGRYSFSRRPSSDGLSHADELIYLFRMAQFSDGFAVGTPEAEMEQIWVKFFVDFATRNSVATEGTCTQELCEIVTFANTTSRYFPVSRKMTVGLDEEMYRFWEKFFQ